MKELQAADEAKAKAEAAQAAKKTAESASGSTAVNNAVTKKPVESTSESDTGTKTPLKTPSESDTKPLDAETLRLLELAPRMTEVIIDMWNASMMRQGGVFVASAIEKKYNAHLGALSREVYQAFKHSNGGEEALQVPIKRYSPHQTAAQKTQTGGQSAPLSAIQPAIITPTTPNSSTNQTQQQNIAPNNAPGGAPRGADSASNSAPGGAPAGAPKDPVLELFERNRNLSDEEVDNQVYLEAQEPFREPLKQPQVQRLNAWLNSCLACRKS